MRSPVAWFAMYGLALATWTGAAPSQTIATAEIAGLVVDPAGKAVSGATVKLKNVETGESRVLQSGVSGVFRFVFVKPGMYEISGQSEGLRSDSGSLVAAVGQVETVDLHLKLEEPRSVVLVSDGAPLLDADNANLVYTLSARQLELLPLPGGDLVSVAYSVPGVVINNRGNNGNLVLQGIGSVSNLFTVNGIDDMDPYMNVNNSGTTGMLLGANEIREASVIENAFEGQYGRQAGAQINYVTKSGTNAYHGNLAYQYNGTLLNANDFFANSTGTPRPLSISNQYAASLGGHVVRNKVFFFADTEGLRFAQPSPNHVAAIPSPALQAYILRTVQPSQAPFYEKMFDLYNNALAIGRAVAVTTGSGPLQDRSGRLGCGRFLAGTPTGSGGTFGTDVSCAEAWETNASTLVSEWLLATRVDFNLSDRQRLYVRFKTDHGYLPYNISDISPLFDVFSRQPDYEGQVSDTFILTPHLVNNFIGSVTYNDYVFAVPNLNAAVQAFPARVQLNDGGTNATFLSPVGAPAAYPNGRRAGQFQIIDDVSYSNGRHFLKAGLNYRYNPESDLGYAGFASVGKFTLPSLATFASGALSGNSSYFQNFNPNPVFHLRLYNLGAYVQDQWAPTRDLKITGALRVDRTGNPDCLDDCFSRFSSPFANLAKGAAIPYNQSIQTGLAHAFYHIEPLIPQPRFGLAYHPDWSRATVLRGGIGLFYDLYPAVFASNLAGNAPNIFTTQIHTGLISPGGPGSAPAIAAASASAFERSFAGGATLPQLQQVVAPASFAAPYYYSIPSMLRGPKSLQWNFEVQHQIGTVNVLVLRYAGNHGYDIFVTDPNANANTDPSFYPNGFAGLPTATPDSRFGLVSQLTNGGYANYHSLAAIWRRRFAHGFQGQISYTWSHALDTLSNGGILPFSFDSVEGQINPLNLRSLNYSNADYDARHNLTGDVIWEMPRLRNRWLNSAVGGWSAGGRVSDHTGIPFSVTNSGIEGLPASFGGTVLAYVMDPHVRTECGDSAVNTPCVTAKQFAPPATQTNLGNLPRNSFRGPGFFNVDASLFKTAVRHERLRMALGANAYSLLNHPNFAAPVSDVASSGLGLIQATAIDPSGPYGFHGGPSGRALVVTAKLAF